MSLFGWKGLPELARDLSSDVRQAGPLFDRRVKEQYPVGMSADALLTELKTNGFRLVGESHDERGVVRDATFYRRRFPFATLWSVRWRESAGKIEEIWGVYGVIGP